MAENNVKTTQPNKFTSETAREAGKKSSNKGQLQKKTIIKLALKDRIADFDERMYEVTDELLKDPKTKAFAWKELNKYRIPVKSETDLNLTSGITLKVEKFID